jgi:murein DD-endopeptidase MepM/ murein hydrolase activator NlpD
MYSTVRVTALLVLLTLATVDSGPVGAKGRYLAPVVDNGKVFPLARTNWFSVINFSNDWHEPRMRLIEGVWRQVGFHEGTDIFAEPGTPVRTVTDGEIEQVGWTFYSGWRVGVRSPEGDYWFYAHLSRFAPGIEVGAPVAAGDALGAVGNTGYGFEPGHSGEFIYHLHIGIQEPSGVWVNPYPTMKKLYRAAVGESQ